MPEARGDQERDPYEAKIVRRVATRAPFGFALFLACLLLSTFFEMLRFPARRAWMGAFAAGFVVLLAIVWPLVRRRPTWAVPLLIAFVNVVGVGLNAYHVIVGAPVAMCMWTLTGLLGASAVVLPWGSRSQALACLGTVLSYPLHLAAGTADPLTWSAGGTYLLIVASLSVVGAALFERHLRRALQLSAALSEREARLQSYFDLALVGAAIVSPDGMCREVNDELCGMLGWTRAELLGRSWLELLDAAERAEGAALLARALPGPGAPRRDMRCRRKDGGTVEAIVSVRGLPGPGGRVDHLMLLVQDITERKHAETEREAYLVRAEAARHEAEEASRAKDAFLATVSHELRTPLTPILAWAGILRDDPLPAESAARALAAIQRNARAQARLIEDLLDVSRIVSGEWRMTLRPVDLTAVVRAAVDVVRPAADARNVTLEATLPDEALPVQGDAERLQQVVWNLLSNAVKFTPPGGRVELVLERAGERIRLLVHDSGEGIAPDFLPHVFERFRQADSSSTRRHTGLGLGLAIVRALVERHGGTVRAESAGEGYGATFTVELPPPQAHGEAAVEPLRRAAREPSPEARPPLGGLHVLVVDDDPDSNEAVSALLAARGAEVRTAVSTPEALEIAGRWRPDVLVSDLAMPGEDGFALLRRLRSRGGALGSVPAIALTAYAARADQQRALEAGFQAHVAKPFDPAQLAHVVEAAVQAAPKPAA